MATLIGKQLAQKPDLILRKGLERPVLLDLGLAYPLGYESQIRAHYQRAPAKFEKEDAMAEDLLAGIPLESISVDEEGRVIIKDPKVAERLREGVTAARGWGGTNTNCHGCNGSNYKGGCGVKAQ